MSRIKRRPLAKGRKKQVSTSQQVTIDSLKVRVKRLEVKRAVAYTVLEKFQIKFQEVEAKFVEANAKAEAATQALEKEAHVHVQLKILIAKRAKELEALRDQLAERTDCLQVPRAEIQVVSPLLPTRLVRFEDNNQHRLPSDSQATTSDEKARHNHPTSYRNEVLDVLVFSPAGDQTVAGMSLGEVTSARRY